MYEETLRYLFPIMIALVLVNFAWAWILTAVKPPAISTDKRISGRVNPDLRYFDAGPEGVRKSIAEKMKPTTKVKRTS